MSKVEVNVTTLPRTHRCRLCESAEYDIARRLLQRSGLNDTNWGFLLHDITSQLREQKFYELGVDNDV